MSTEADIVERIDAERTARADDPMRPANPLLREAAAEITKLRAECDAAQARIAELDKHCDRLGRGGAERYWEGRYRDEAARSDAAARDMRERCAKVVENHLRSHFLRITGEKRLLSEAEKSFAAAIRALPDTPAVIATDGGTNG